MGAYIWKLFEHNLYFGDHAGNVWKAYYGETDGAILNDDATLTLGEPITAECQTAFNFMAEQSTVKHAKMVKPTFIGAGGVNYHVKVNSDYSYVPATSPGATPGNLGDVWNQGLWGKAKWSGAPTTQKLWTAVSGIGNAFALRIAYTTYTPVLWASYDIMYEDGTNI